MASISDPRIIFDIKANHIELLNPSHTRSIRLPDPSSYAESPLVQTAASVPWFLVGVANNAWAWVQRQAEGIPFLNRRMPRTRVSYGGYRGLAQEEDAAVSCVG